MVCRFIDGFDYYSTSQVTRKYSVGDVGLITGDSRTGAGAIRGNNVNQKTNKTFDDQVSWIIGAAYQIVVGNNTLIQFLDITTVQCSLIIRSSGSIEVVNGTATVVAGGKSIITLREGNWYYIEMKVTISNSIAADSCIVRVNEVEVINVDAGEDLQVSVNATADVIRIINVIGQSIDDLYVFDGNDGGGTEPTNDDFVGDVKVVTHFPDGNGATNNFTGSDADSVDNYLLVDENPTDDDTTYVESSIIGHIDLYTVDDITDTPITIHAIQINSVVRKDDSGTKTVRPVIRPTSTNFFGASKSPQDGVYSNETEVLNEDPETEMAWTKSGFNAAEFGIEIET